MEMDNYTENLMLSSGKFKEEKDYWLDKLSGVLILSSFPADIGPDASNQSEKAVVSRTFPENISKSLVGISNNSEYGLYMILLCGVKYLMRKYTGSDDIVLGVPSFKQDEQNVTGSIFALRTKFGDWTFKDLLLDVRKTVGDARRYRNISFDMIAEQLDLKLKDGTPPKIRTVVLMKNIHHIPAETTGVDMVFSFLKKDESIELELEYDCGLYARGMAEGLAGYLINFYSRVLENTVISLAELDVISEEEKTQLLCDFDGTKAAYPEYKVLHQLLEEQANKTPDRVAAAFIGETFTYRALNERANQIARTLRDKGVGADSIVGIMLERSLDMLTGLFGILKAGGAYLPIDPEYPTQRIMYMMDDSGADILLTQRRFANYIAFEKETIYLDDEELYEGNRSNLENISTPGNLAYITYVSSPAGNAKGVMIEHLSAVNRLNWMQKKYPMGENDAVLQKTPYTLGPSVWELFGWTLAGARICFLEPGNKEPGEIVEAIEKYKITTMHFIPSQLREFVEYVENEKSYESLMSLKQVFTGEEALKARLAGMFGDSLNMNCGTRLCNLYGLAEAAGDVSSFDYPAGSESKNIPIGKPIDNIRLYVLDRNKQLQPVGVQGELYVSGIGLARGYFNSSELTAEKFVSNPFAEGERMFGTGDLARWLPDGNLEYLGRTDKQLKIKGFRIELGEIEACLLEHEAVKEAVVIGKTDKFGSKYLYAYINVGEEVSPMELKDYVSKHLPYHMVPAYYKKLDKIPIAPDGSVDREALLELEDSEDTRLNYVPPRNELESKIAEVWKDVLRVDKVGIDDDIIGLGANSLLAMRLELAMEMNDLEVTNVEIFQYRTIRNLSKYIEDKQWNEADMTQDEELDKILF